MPFKKDAVLAISNCRGLSGQIMFAMDRESKPDHYIMHFVRLETVVLPSTIEVNQAHIATLTPEADPRLLCLAQCFTHDHIQALYKTMGALSIALTTLDMLTKYSNKMSIEDQAFLATTIETVTEVTNTQ